MLTIGLMSGTSTDGVDGVLVDFSEAKPVVVAAASQAFPQAVRAELLALNAPGHDELHRSAQAANAVSQAYALVVAELLVKANLPANAVAAVGAHGQTVRHHPPGFGRLGADSASAATPYTLQIQNPALLAERCGIAVVADFRSRDIAAGGQGAPLVPAFHQAVLAQAGQCVAVVNIGGIANVSVIRADTVQGFDTGPGNVLLDLWCQRHTGKPYDDAGQWGMGGQVNHGLLQTLLAESFFAQKPPKSTGRDLFHADWLSAHLEQHAALSAQDAQATLVELTARSIRLATALYAPDATELLVCGGGVYNQHLMRRLQVLHPNSVVQSTAAKGIHPMHMEAMAFAWLAKQCLQNLPGNLPGVTGAAGLRVLGAVYPK